MVILPGSGIVIVIWFASSSTGIPPESTLTLTDVYSILFYQQLRYDYHSNNFQQLLWNYDCITGLPVLCMYYSRAADSCCWCIKQTQPPTQHNRFYSSYHIDNNSRKSVKSQKVYTSDIKDTKEPTAMLLFFRWLWVGDEKGRGCNGMLYSTRRRETLKTIEYRKL